MQKEKAGTKASEGSRARPTKAKVSATLDDESDGEKLEAQADSPDEEAAKPVRGRRAPKKRKEQSPVATDEEGEPLAASQPEGKKAKA